jgi:hypothetical protein
MRDAVRTAAASDVDDAKTLWDMGKFFREAIYYGAQSAFDFQYLRFARNRYRHDSDWMLANEGIAIRSIVEIANSIIRRITLQVSTLVAISKDRKTNPTAAELSNALIIEKESLLTDFGDKSQRFLELFAIPINSSNEAFTDPFSFNKAAVSPLIDLGDYLYVSNQFKLAESIYESPFYWMLLDQNYCDVASENRGKFLEKTIYRLLTKTFGEKNVFSNVVIWKNKAEIAAEADVLVVFGEFILVVQAKSKRLTMQARAGDFEKITIDFNKAVQHAYDQSIEFINLLLSGAECVVAKGEVRNFRFVSRVFPIVVLSENLPSLSLLVNDLIKIHGQQFPAIFDIFFLQTLTEVLKDPVEILYYLQQRTRFFDKLHSDRELNLLGFHLRHKLYIPSEYDLVDIGNDFASDIDEYLIDQELRRKSKVKFTKLEERAGVPEIVELIAALKAGPAEIAGVAIELLDFSEVVPLPETAG